MSEPQPITPELREWIIAQAQAGHRPEAVLKSMCDSGWHEDVALAALESTLQGYLEAHAQAARPAVAEAGARARPRRSPISIDAGDRERAGLADDAQPARHRVRRTAVAMTNATS